MKKLICLLFILPLVFASSCKKGVSVEGFVYEINSTTPVSDATVNLVIDEGGGLSGSKIRIVATTTSDNKGHFVVTYKEGSGLGGTGIYANKKGYYDYGTTNDEVKSSKQNVFVTPPAWIKIHVVNTTPFDDNDEIRVIGPWLPVNNFSEYGKNGNLTSEKVEIEGNYDNKIIWDVTKNSIKKRYIDNVFIKGHDTTTYEIKY